MTAYVCKICKDRKTFGSRKSVRRHIREEHGIYQTNRGMDRAKGASSVTQAMERKD